MLTSFELSSEARQVVGRAWFGVASTPLQVRPAWNSSSAVRLLRSTAGCPLRVVEVMPQAVLGSLEVGL